MKKGNADISDGSCSRISRMHSEDVGAYRIVVHEDFG